MQVTSLALEHLLCAIGDPIREICDIGPDHPEFVRAQTIRAGAGVLAKATLCLRSRRLSGLPTRFRHQPGCAPTSPRPRRGYPGTRCSLPKAMRSS